MSAKAGGCSPGSSSSSGGESKRPRDPEAEIRDLREQIEQLKRHKSVEKRQGALCEPAGGESGLEKDGKMEIDEEVDRKKMLDQRKKELQKQLREIERFTDIPKGTEEIFKEK